MSRRRPPPSEWTFPPIDTLPPGEDLIATGADLEPATLIGAYSTGYFPMPLPRRRLGWFSPDPRGVLLLDDLHVSRSLQRSMRSFRITVDHAFAEVITACGDPSRPHGWIDQRIVRAYTRLHHEGWAHSIEVWDDDGLAGGLYGVQIGGFFAGESMFHRRTDASKAALVGLDQRLARHPDRLIDVQWSTDHLATLGVRTLPRPEYARRLAAAIALEESPALGGPS